MEGSTTEQNSKSRRKKTSPAESAKQAKEDCELTSDATGALCTEGYETPAWCQGRLESINIPRSPHGYSKRDIITYPWWTYENMSQARLKKFSFLSFFLPCTNICSESVIRLVLFSALQTEVNQEIRSLLSWIYIS